MRIETVSKTDNPATTVCKAARNDYFDGFIGDHTYEETMAAIGEPDDSINEKESLLIEQLVDRGHFGPQEHVSITFAVEGVSRACMAQARTHRHMSFDVQSMRYVDMDGDAEDIVKAPATLREEETVNREQGLTDLDERDREIWRSAYYKHCSSMIDLYNDLLDIGLPKEDARFILPIGTKVNMVMSANARSWLHFADMRRNAAAQWEIRELADAVIDECIDWFPELFEYYDAKGPNKLAP